MRLPLVRKNVALFTLPFIALGFTWAAETNSTKAPSSSGKAAATRPGAKGPLPDPTLLDGSTHPAEKRSEYGMIGDFELPGDQNVRSDRVGGPQVQVPVPGAGVPLPLPQKGGGGLPGMPSAGLPMPQQGSPGMSIPQLPDPTAQQGQGGSGPQNPAAAGQQVQGGGQQGGQPQGAQVGQLSGEGGGPEQGAIGEKPPQVSIGDQAMQIKTIPNPASVVGGAQPAGNTQQHEKTPGTGGKGAAGNNSNKGVERGRAIPAGL